MTGTILLLVVCAAVTVQSQSWRIVSKGIGTTDLGVACSDANTCFTAATANGAGPEILKTSDGAQTWNPLNVSFGADLLLLDADVSGNSIVVSSIFGELFSTDGGNTWGNSKGGGISQSVHAFAGDTTGQKFGLTGTFGGKQGVAVSSNGGKTFTRFPINALFTDARYGAFPSDTTWYVSAGSWGSPAPPAPAQPGAVAAVHVNSRGASHTLRKSVFQDDNGHFPASYIKGAYGATDGYQAQIVKTSDGGKTWSTQFAQNGTFYFNGIDCDHTNPDHCCAVGEASDDGAANDGARILCTFDGQTWSQTFFSQETSKEGFSLMEIRFAAPNDVWAVGGELTHVSPSAWFLHSIDGGKTWVNNQAPIVGSMALSITMVDSTVGYAALDNTLLQQADVAKFGI